ncbi:mRNA turnover and ribosome assembly protein [Ascosphaera acerosa]|nr:mRNA turnover and ribosome assembly protein [Ascosphaera acerosa]
MARSKRARLVHESKVTKKAHKEQNRLIFQNVQEAVGQYAHLFVFSVDNMRNTYLKDVRQEFSDSRLFFGKTKVMALALGATPETACAPNLEKLNSFMTGAVGLLFTNRDPQAVLSHLATFRPLDFARAGDVATRDFTIPNGVVYAQAGEVAPEHDQPLSHTIEPQLRKLGVPTRLVKGKVTLEMDGGYPVCKAGKTLDSRQTTLLKMFGVRMAEFRVAIKAQWDREGGKVTVLQKSGEEMETE